MTIRFADRKDNLVYWAFWCLFPRLLADVSILEETPLRKTIFFSLLCCSHALVTIQAQHWLLPREANFSHMFITFIPSNGPICLSKCVCCVLFPARFVPMPSLRWVPLSPGVGAEASRYLYRLNSWGPPSQSSEGWVEIIMEASKRWKFLSVLSFILFFKLSFLPHRYFSPGCPEWPGQAGFSSGQLDHQTKLIWVSFVIPFAFLFIQSPTDVFSPFSLSEILFPIKLLCVWNRIKEAEFSLQLCLDTFCLFVALDKAELLLQTWAFCVSSLLFCAVTPVVHVLYYKANIELFVSLISARSFRLVCPILVCLLFANVSPPHVNHSGGKRE